MATRGIPARLLRLEQALARMQASVKSRRRDDDEVRLYLLKRVAKIERDMGRHVKGVTRLLQRCHSRIARFETRVSTTQRH